MVNVAAEMERQGFEIPCSSAGDDVELAHTAVKVDQRNHGPVVGEGRLRSVPGRRPCYGTNTGALMARSPSDCDAIRVATPPSRAATCCQHAARDAGPRHLHADIAACPRYPGIHRFLDHDPQAAGTTPTGTRSSPPGCAGGSRHPQPPASAEASASSGTLQAMLDRTIAEK